MWGAEMGGAQGPDVTYDRNTLWVQIRVMAWTARGEPIPHRMSSFSDLSLLDQGQSLPLEWPSQVLLTYYLNKPERGLALHHLGTPVGDR